MRCSPTACAGSARLLTKPDTSCSGTVTPMSSPEASCALPSPPKTATQASESESPHACSPDAARPTAEKAATKSASRTSHCPSVPRSSLKCPGIISLSPTSATNSAPQTTICAIMRGGRSDAARGAFRLPGAARLPPRFPGNLLPCHLLFMPSPPPSVSLP